jgi:hypothetical protein
LYWKNAGFQALAGKFAQELLLVHSVLEGFAAVDENNRHLVVELAAKFSIGIDVDLAPGETTAAREFGKALFDDFAKMASFARVHENSAGL